MRYLNDSEILDINIILNECHVFATPIMSPNDSEQIISLSPLPRVSQLSTHYVSTKSKQFKCEWRILVPDEFLWIMNECIDKIAKINNNFRIDGDIKKPINPKVEITSTKRSLKCVNYTNINFKTDNSIISMIVYDTYIKDIKVTYNKIRNSKYNIGSVVTIDNHQDREYMIMDYVYDIHTKLVYECSEIIIDDRCDIITLSDSLFINEEKLTPSRDNTLSEILNN